MKLDYFSSYLIFINLGKLFTDISFETECIHHQLLITGVIVNADSLILRRELIFLLSKMEVFGNCNLCPSHACR